MIFFERLGSNGADSISQKTEEGLQLPTKSWDELKIKLLGTDKLPSFLRRSVSFIEEHDSEFSLQNKVALLVYACLLAPEFTANKQEVPVKKGKERFIRGQEGIANIIGIRERDVKEYIKYGADRLEGEIDSLLKYAG